MGYSGRFLNVFSHISWVCFNYVVAQNDFQYGFRSIVWLVSCIHVSKSESILENYGKVFGKRRRVEMSSLPQLGLVSIT